MAWHESWTYEEYNKTANMLCRLASCVKFYITSDIIRCYQHTDSFHNIADLASQPQAFYNKLYDVFTTYIVNYDDKYIHTKLYDEHIIIAKLYAIFEDTDVCAISYDFTAFAKARRDAYLAVYNIKADAQSKRVMQREAERLKRKEQCVAFINKRLDECDFHKIHITHLSRDFGCSEYFIKPIFEDVCKARGLVIKSKMQKSKKKKRKL